MTLGALIAATALALAFGAAAIRRRDRFWVLMAFLVVVSAVALVNRDGLRLDLFVGNADGYANVLGAMLAGLGVFVAEGLPGSYRDRLLYGPHLPAIRFDRAVAQARRPYAEAAQAQDETMDEKARGWRTNVVMSAPSPAWAALADRLARSDREWVEGVRSRLDDAAWEGWRERNAELGRDWVAARAPALARGRMRGRFLAGGGWTLVVAGIVSIGIGGVGLPSAYASLPPQGHAAVVPERPFGHGVTLVPMGDVSEDDMLDLAHFYGDRYANPVAVVPAIRIPDGTFDPSRRQYVGENLIAALRASVPQAFFEEQVVIGVVDQDMYVRGRPEWRFAFGTWAGNVGVVSTRRMGATFDWFDRSVERARLRKMVTRYIGFMLYGLPESSDRSSVLFQPLLSRDDLDTMGEDYR